jgi:hypothetical protein
MAKNHDLSDKKNSVCHAPLPLPLTLPLPPFAKICTTPSASPLQARKLKFWLPQYFEPTVPHTQNFEV